MRFVFIVMLAVGFSSGAMAVQSVGQELRDFKRDPRTYMQRVPPKFDKRGSVIRIPSVLSADINHRYRPESEIRRNDDPADLVGGDLSLVTLEAMQAAGLTSARLGNVPWSGDYWPLASGLLASRPFDEEFSARWRFKDKLEYIAQHPLQTIYHAADFEGLKRLSIAEKYDLLTGSVSANLTENMWTQASQAKNEDGEVEPWMGLCHGWAPAAFMAPRPEHAINVKAFDGTLDLKIFPDELKGLLTYVWANEPFATRFIGGRCQAKQPVVDSNGRVSDPACLDTNPATWHLSVVNMLGAQARSLVMDATYDYEVWNQPVFAYSYTYFNPETGKEVATLAEARVEKQDYHSDKFVSFRSSRAVAFVGVAMEVTYMGESRTRMNDQVGNDEERALHVRYLYDLEIDRDGHLVGGEWYNNRHPDFLWTPQPQAKPESDWDNLVTGSWDGHSALPQAWRESAMAAASQGHVLSHIVDGLLKASRE